MEKLKILVGCEESGTLRNELRTRGHDAWSVDLQPSEDSKYHIQDDIRNHLHGSWDAIFAFPPCTYLTKAQMWRTDREPGREQLRTEAVQLVEDIDNAPADKIWIENPIGYLNKNWRAATDIVYPWQFGDPYTKEICIWQKGFPVLLPLIDSPGECKLKKVANHTNGRMKQQQKSRIKSSWKYYPNLVRGMLDQYEL